jgi:hypothetical protein
MAELKRGPQMTGDLIKLLLCLPVGIALAEPPPPFAEIAASIRPDHPRLFVNADMLPAMREYARTTAKPHLDALLKRVDARVPTEELEINPKYAKLDDQGRMVFIRNRGNQNTCQYGVKTDAGTEANECALAWLLTGKDAYRVKAIAYLRLHVKFCQLSQRSRIMSNWYNYSRICALAAYDWVSDTLSPAERTEILLPLLKYVAHMEKPGYQRNGGGIDTGYYGESALRWYGGLVGYRAGVDDALAEGLLTKGYAHYVAMMNHRDKLSAGSGLLISTCSGYTFAAYPWASYNFLHSLRSACNADGRRYWTQMADYAHYFNWMCIRGVGDRLYEFGWGDARHSNNILPTYLMYTHLAQAIHFYGKDFPERARQAQALMTILPDTHRRLGVGSFPFTAFLLTGFDESVTVENPEAQLGTGELAAFFPSFGMVNMRSGFGADATYASFKVGARNDGHQHYDENTFIIYKRGFQAMDTGTRDNAKHHLLYYPQTIAHNGILIRMADEPLARHWYPANAPRITEKSHSDGGQDARKKAVNLGFEQSAYHVVSGGDATRCYSEKKCREAIRQFVYLTPDLFVVYDRVTSVLPDQQKVWLWHTQNEPVAQAPGLFRAAHEEGAMLVRTLLPAATKHEVIGGPGREYWTNDRNWPIFDQQKRLARSDNQYGRYRLEVSPAENGERTRFLHVLQVGPKALTTMVPTKRIQTDAQDGVELDCPDQQRRYQVLFSRDGPIGGHIKVWNADGKALLDQPLLQPVEPIAQ